jgi:hypothetical protein
MANTKITSHVIANDAVTVDMITDAAVTADKLHATLDLSGKTLTLPATAIPSASTATTQSAADNSTKIATTAYVETAIANLNDSAPAALNTLNEIAAALGDDANYASTTTAAIAAKLPLAGGTMTGAIAMGTAKITGLGDPTANQDAGTKTYIDTADALKLNLSGGTLTGDLILNTTTALKIPAGTTAQRPSAATGQLRWNTSDGALEVYNGSAWTAVGTGSSNKILDTFTGDGSTTAFTLTVTPANEDALIVFIDGVYQEKGDYALSNAVLTLDTAPASGEKLAVHITTASVHDGTSGLNQQFTGDGSTVAFTLSQDPKSENNTQIYINGVYQQKTDYTVSGTTLTFDTAPETGDIIEVNMFTVTTLGNTDTVSEGTSNLYHTDARARGAISVSGNALSYNSSTGVITSAYEESPTFTGDVVFNSTGSIKIPIGTTAQRPASPANGMVRYNTTESEYEVYKSNAWLILDSSGYTYTADFLVIAGGGGGSGASLAGGGGAGGYRTSAGTSGGGASAESALTFVGGTTYTITVGAGGSGGANGSNGGNSLISGSGLATITSIGGGSGSNNASAGASGGSGGGSGRDSVNTGGAGTSGQGFAGGTGGGSSNSSSASGGGGAGAVGANAASPWTGGNGGVGVASTITGSSVYRAGGGGGAAYSGLGRNGGTGGNGGGGNGSGNVPTSATAGTANTGGGGGGGMSNSSGGSGGSGVVILRVATSKYSGTTTGSPTVTTSGSNTIITFNSSGSYTA